MHFEGRRRTVLLGLQFLRPLFARLFLDFRVCVCVEGRGDKGVGSDRGVNASLSRPGKLSLPSALGSSPHFRPHLQHVESLKLIVHETHFSHVGDFSSFVDLCILAS